MSGGVAARVAAASAGWPVADVAAALRTRYPRWQLPAFRADELRPRATRYCVCVFVRDEGERIRGQLQRMASYAPELDVIVADGGSRDGALDLPFLRTVRVRTLLTKTGAGRLSAQMRMALGYALDEGYSGMIVIDGNGKDDVSALPEFVRLLEAGYDHVQGSRFIPGGRQVNTPWSRLIAIRLLHAPLVSLAGRRRQTDTTNGFRAYSSRLVADARIDVFRDVFDSYELHPYLAIESCRDGRFVVAETPVTRAYPRGGGVPTKISPVRGNARFALILLRAALGKYRTRHVVDGGLEHAAEARERADFA
jgi:dolichol-phosphate mannosyltransferase